MADAKKSDFKKYLKWSAIILTASYGLVVLDTLSEKKRMRTPITGKVVELDYNATVYDNLTDMVKRTNGKEGYYDTSSDRLVISTFYNVNGNFVRVNMEGNYTEYEQQLIDNNGFIVGVITTVDFINKTPEAFYNISDLKVKAKQLSMN